MEYRDHMLDLASHLLQILALGLPYGPKIFEELNFQPVANVRLLHYPPQRSTDARQLGGKSIISASMLDIEMSTFFLRSFTTSKANTQHWLTSLCHFSGSSY